MPITKKRTGTTDLKKEVTDLKWAIVHSAETLKRYHQARRQLSLSFLKGVASALGAMVAVVIVIPLVLFALQSISWPPIINGIVSTIIHQIEQSNPQSPPGAVDQ